MRNAIIAALMIGAASLPTAAEAQQAASISQSIAGTRLDINATGEVTRVPDIANITAGVTTRAATAGSALQQAATRMARVRAALKRAGIEDRDLQTSNISLSPEYKYADNQAPRIVGYSASNQLSVRFRDIARAGAILDVLVAEGANSLSGPTLSVDRPEAALDEARAKAVASGRARAELYARSMGLRVARTVAVTETGSYTPAPPPMPMMMEARAQAADTKVDPGEQKLQVNLTMTFELQ